MSVTPVEHAKLLLEHSRLKRNFLESQIQFLSVQRVLVDQEIERHENELSILQSSEETQAEEKK